MSTVVVLRLVALQASTTAASASLTHRRELLLGAAAVAASQLLLPRPAGAEGFSSVIDNDDEPLSTAAPEAAQQAAPAAPQAQQPAAGREVNTVVGAQQQQCYRSLYIWQGGCSTQNKQQHEEQHGHVSSGWRHACREVGVAVPHSVLLCT